MLGDENSMGAIYYTILYNSKVTKQKIKYLYNALINFDDFCGGGK